MLEYSGPTCVFATEPLNLSTDIKYFFNYTSGIMMWSVDPSLLCNVKCVHFIVVFSDKGIPIFQPASLLH